MNRKYFYLIYCPISELEILSLQSVVQSVNLILDSMDIFSDCCLISLTSVTCLWDWGSQGLCPLYMQSQCGVNDIPAFAGQAVGCNELIIPVNSAILNIRCMLQGIQFLIVIKSVFWFFSFFIIKPEVINTRIFRVKMFDFLIYWIIKRWNLNCAAY